MHAGKHIVDIMLIASARLLTASCCQWHVIITLSSLAYFNSSTLLAFEQLPTAVKHSYNHATIKSPWVDTGLQGWCEAVQNWSIVRAGQTTPYLPTSAVASDGRCQVTALPCRLRHGRPQPWQGVGPPMLTQIYAADDLQAQFQASESSTP